MLKSLHRFLNQCDVSKKYPDFFSNIWVLKKVSGCLRRPTVGNYLSNDKSDGVNSGAIPCSWFIFPAIQAVFSIHLQDYSKTTCRY